MNFLKIKDKIYNKFTLAVCYANIFKIINHKKIRTTIQLKKRKLYTNNNMKEIKNIGLRQNLLINYIFNLKNNMKKA